MAKRFTSCPIPNDFNSYVDRMQAIIDKHLDQFPDDQDVALRVLTNSLIESEPGLASVIDEAVKRRGSELQFHYFSGEKIDISQTSDQLQGSTNTNFVNNAASLSAEMTTDSENIDSNNEDHVYRTGAVNITESGMDTFDTDYNRAIGQKLNAKDRSLVKGKAIEFDDVLDFYNWTVSHFKLDSLEGISVTDLDYESKAQAIESRKRLVSTYWNSHNAINSQDFGEVREVIYTNIDHTVNLESLDDVADAILHPSDKRLVSRPRFNMMDKKDESSTVGRSFLDNSPIKIRNKSIQASTLFVNLKSSGRLVKEMKDSQATGQWWMFPDHHNFTNKDLELLEYKLSVLEFEGRQAPAVPVALRPGDHGKIITTFINASIFNEILPKDAVIDFMEKLNFSNEMMEYARAYPRTMASFMKQLGKKVKTIQDKRVRGEISKGEQIELTLKEDQFMQLEKVLKPFMVSKLDEYFKYQADQGNMSIDQYRSYVDNAANSAAVNQVGNLSVPNYIHYAGVIARYEWMQAVKGDNFMTVKGGGAMNLFDRIKIALSEGIETRGMGPSQHIIYDQEKVEYYLDGNRLEHLIDVPGIKGLVNEFDGASFVTTDYLNQTGRKTGVYKVYEDESDIRELKTVWFEHTRTAEGAFAGFIEKKHAEFAAIPGLEIRKKDGTVVAKMVEEMGQVRIKDGDGNVVQQISDLDATKTATGIYDLRKSNRVSKKFELQETSRKIIITPNPKSKDSTSNYTQLLDHLNFDIPDATIAGDFNKYKKALLDIITEQSDKFSDALLDATDDPAKLWELVKYNFSESAEAKHELQTILGVTNGKGIFHPNNLTMLKPMLMNMLVVKGAFQGRTTPNKLSNLMDGGLKGSMYVMKPGRRVEEGKVILSADNSAVFDEVASQMIGNDEAAIADFNELGYDDKVDAINEWMKSNPVAVFTYRFPILQLAGVEPRMIQEFTKRDGNAVYHHIKDTSMRLVGDNDYDKASVFLVPPKHLNTIVDFQKTQWWQERKAVNADIGMFEKPEQFDYADPVQMREAMMTLIKGQGAQGIATNMKNIANTLAQKFGKIEFSDGVSVTPKKVTDKVIMNYAPLIDSIASSDIPSNARFVGLNAETGKWENWNAGLGKKYLETTVEHEFLLIANAAVDISKSGMLTAKWGATDMDWYIDRMFHIDGELTKNHYKLLKSIRKDYNYSPLKHAKTPNTRNTMDFKLLNFILSEVKGRMDANPNALAEKYMDELIVRKAFQAKNDEGAYTTFDLRVKSMEVYNKPTATEEFIVRIHDKFQERFGDGLDKVEAPLTFSDSRQEISQLMARKTMIPDLVQSINNEDIDAKDIDIGLNLARDFADEFYPAEEESKVTDENKEAYVRNKQARFDEDLYNLLDKYNGILNGHRIGVKKVFTFMMIYGFDGRRNIKYLPDPIVMDKGVLTNFMNNWERINKSDLDYDAAPQLRKRTNPIGSLIKAVEERCK